MARTASLVRDEKGSIAIVFALAMTGIIAGLGAALDYSRLSGSKSALQSALDAAILNAGKAALATGGQADRSKVIAELKANLPDFLKPMADSVQLIQTTDKLTAQISGTLDNRFGSFLGSPRSSIAAAASVPLGSTRLELALVLDSTGSMASMGKMDALKTAANQLIDTLVANSRSDRKSQSAWFRSPPRSASPPPTGSSPGSPCAPSSRSPRKTRTSSPGTVASWIATSR